VVERRPAMPIKYRIFFINCDVTRRSGIFI
jgi:hypothetical protein